MGILPNNRSHFDLMSAKVMFKVIQLEGFVCVIYMLSSICSSNIMLVIIFFPVPANSDGLLVKTRRTFKNANNGISNDVTFDAYIQALIHVDKALR